MNKAAAELRALIALQVDHYLSTGGRIEKVPTHVFGKPERGTTRAMMNAEQLRAAENKLNERGDHWRGSNIAKRRR